MENTKLNLFISYSHNDNQHVNDFWNHTAPLRDNGTLDMWYDQNITAGDDFWDKIDEHLADRDIICCFISSHYISSRACKKELETALELREKKGVLVIPIILSPCAWMDLPIIKHLLAIPSDGKPISSFTNSEEAWLDVYNHLKNASEKHFRLKDLSFSKKQLAFLDDATLLTKAHGNKNELKMSDIYVHPDVEKKNNIGSDIRMSFEKLVSDFSSGARIAIVGEDQSGKTTLAKKFVLMLKEKGFIPVYIKDEQEVLQGDLISRVSRLFKEQYRTEHEISDYDTNRVVPIVDDFHKARNKETVLERLSVYKQLIIIVDTIFDIDIIQEKTIISFDRYVIKPLKPSLRNELIRKWITISETSDYDPEFINGDYMQIDERMDVVDSALGKVMGKNIMPAYPFFVLTLLSNYDSINKPLNEEITSQGYCYQALIVLFLGKQGVVNETLDSYINFLTEFSYRRFKHQSPLSQAVFMDFYYGYTEEYNMTENKEALLRKLKASGIIRVSSLGNYDFNYPYLYYFFAGKYFAEHLDDREPENRQVLEEIETILDNLHKNENAYITIFMVHHTKDKTLIEKLLKRADGLFKNYSPATMSKEEMAFFKTNEVKKIELSSKNAPNEARKERLKKLDVIEEKMQSAHEEDEDDSELSLELRRSMKTVEVLGRIITNRSGSMKAVQLQTIFEKGMNVHLRVISSFFQLVKDMIAIPNYDSFIQEQLLETNPNMSQEDAAKKSQKFFWGMNFGFIIGMITKISTSLGSKSTIKISDAVCSQSITPIKFLIQQDIAMRYSKNLRLDDMKKIDELDMPLVAIRAYAYSIVQFCKYNRISESDRNELMRFGIRKQFLLPMPKSKEETKNFN